MPAGTKDTQMPILSKIFQPGVWRDSHLNVEFVLATKKWDRNHQTLASLVIKTLSLFKGLG